MLEQREQPDGCNQRQSPRRVLRRVLAAAMATVAILAGSVFLARFLHLQEDVTAMLPADDPVVSDYRLVADRFRLLDVVCIDIGAESGDPDHAVAVGDALGQLLLKSGKFDAVQYRFSAEGFVDAFDAMSSRKSCLLSPGDLNEIERRLDLQSIHRCLARARQGLLEPSGPFIRQRVRQDPLNFDDILLAKFQSMSPLAHGYQVIDGRLWSADQRHLLMLATPRVHAMDTGNGSQVIGAVNAGVAEALKAAPSGAVRISYSSGHRASLDNANSIKGDLAVTTIAMTAGIVLLGCLLFRRKWLVALVLLPPLVGAAVAAALFALTGSTLSAVAIGCATALMGITVDCGIHVLYRVDNEGDLAQPKQYMRKVYGPLILAALTTIAAQGCMLLSSLPGQRQMGMFSILGVTVTACFALALLPRLIPPLRARKARVSPLRAMCERFLAWQAGHQKAINICTLVVLAMTLAGLPRLRFEGDVSRLSYLSAQTVADQDRVASVWGQFLSSSVIVRGRSLDEALEKNDRLAATLRDLQRQGRLVSFSSVASMLPSPQTQRQNAEHWRAFWNPQRRSSLSKALRDAGESLNFAPGAFDPFLQVLDGTATPMGLQDLPPGQLLDMIKGRIVQADGQWLVISTFEPADPAAMGAVKAAVAGAVPGSSVLNLRDFVEHVTAIVREQTRMFSIAGGIAITLCLLLFFARVELLLAVLIPVLLSIAATLGILGLCGIPINMINCLFIVFIFGVAVDFSIFLMSSRLDSFWGRGDEQAAAMGSVAACALTSLLGFAALVLARHPALFSLGMTGAIGMATGLAVAIFVVPAMCRCLIPQNVRHRSVSLKMLLGGLFIAVYLAVAATLYLVALYPVLQVAWRTRAAARQRITRRYIQKVFAVLIRTVPYLDSRRLVINPHGEDFSKPSVLVANHQSVVDIAMILSLRCDMVMLVKRWVWRLPVCGTIIRQAGYIPVDEGDVEGLLRQAGDCLKKGTSLAIFPEGTRSPDGTIHRFHNGAFELAIRTGSDIIPLLLTDTRSCIPPGAFWMGDHRCIMRILPRVTMENCDYRGGAKALANEVRRKLLDRQPADWRLAQEGRAFWHNIRNLYNYAGGRVEYYIAWKLRLDPLHRGVSCVVPQQGTILDLGCGYGLMSHILARKSRQREVIGLDYDDGKIALARRSAIGSGNVRFQTADLRSFSILPADVVILTDVLHYWAADQQERIVSRACECLRPGGTLIFRDGARCDSWKHRMVLWGEKFTTWIKHNLPAQGLNFLPERSYIEAFERHGLRLQERLGSLGCWSNVVLLFRKAAAAQPAQTGTEAPDSKEPAA